MVRLRYPRHSIRSWAKELIEGEETAAMIELSGVVPWRIEVDGGVSRLSADLNDLQLAALRVGGGASRVELMLPRPEGVVSVRIGGGASHLTIHRPQGAAARLRVQDGASRLALDEPRSAAIGGEVRWQSSDFAAATDRYEIEVAGGASDLVLDIR